MRPAADPLAVVQVWRGRRTVARVGFVITAACTNRARPARPAVGLFGNVMRVEKLLLPLPADAAAHVAESVSVRSRESVTQRHVTIGRDAHQTNAGTTWISLGVTLVQLLKRLANIREPVMAILERGIAILEGQAP